LPTPWIDQPVILILIIEQFISGSSTTCDFGLFRLSLDMISKFQDAIESLSSSRLGTRWVSERCRNAGRRKFKLVIPLYSYNKGLQFFVFGWLIVRCYESRFDRLRRCFDLCVETTSHISFDRPGIYVQTTLFLSEILFFRPRLNSLIFLPILAENVIVDILTL